MRDATPRVLLFDLDGTLTDNFEGIANCIRYALAHMDVADPGDEALRVCVGPPLRETLPQLIGRSDAATIERAVGLYRERFSELGWRENRAYPGIAEMLAAAKQSNPRTFLCTTKPQQFAEKIIGHFGYGQFIDGIYGTSLDGLLDDKANLLAHLLAREKLDGANCVMIGDRKHDIRAARRNGARSLGVLWGYGSRAELLEAGATGLIAHPGEFEPGLAEVQAVSS